MLDVMPPLGQFGTAAAAAAGAGQHLLMVAGGSGITPILSMLKRGLEQQPTSRFTLLYGNRTLASTMFKDTLADLKNRYLGRLALHWVFSREGVDSPLHSGRLDQNKITDFLRLMAPVDQAFVCGPHALNDNAQAALLAAGLPAAHIHIERFGLPPELLPAHPQPVADVPAARLRIVRDGATRELAFLPTDSSILAAASRAGLDVPYSCKSGVCATCKAKLLVGQVQMVRNFALTPEEVAAGFVLTCQARPLTAEVMLSFDER
jgi:ring-1,2-phenylacetyl-CoA epoxidase subunit PaaE